MEALDFGEKEGERGRRHHHQVLGDEFEVYSFSVYTHADEERTQTSRCKKHYHRLVQSHKGSRQLIMLQLGQVHRQIYCIFSVFFFFSFE